MTFKTTRGYVVITVAGGGIGKNTCLSIAESGASGILRPNRRARIAGVRPILIFDSIPISLHPIEPHPPSTPTLTPPSPPPDRHQHALPLSESDHILNTNTRGTLLCNRAIARAMLLREPVSHQGRYTERSLGRGCIVNLGSANSAVAFPGKTAYTTAKHAVVGITKSGAVDYASHGIRINAICATWVAGPMNMHEASLNPHFEHMVQAVVPLKRVAQPDEVADAIHFLCSPAATYITGATLIIDAGSGLTVRLF
ncbi:hypothetical protein EAF00_002538 [Botryotinia globosa]|nr:hypothetical protein EAF00_002538 [Botryotinia globosa]